MSVFDSRAAKNCKLAALAAGALISQLSAVQAGVIATVGTQIASPDFTYAVTPSNTSDLTFTTGTNIVRFNVSGDGLFSDFVQLQGFAVGTPTRYDSGDVSGGKPYVPLDIASKDGDLSALSFQLGTGYNYTLPVSAYFEAFNDGSLVGSGSITAATASFITFSGAAFDELKIGTYFQSFSSFSGPFLNGNATVVGNVRGSLVAVTDVPEPFTLSIFGAGFLGAAALKRKRPSRV